MGTKVNSINNDEQEAFAAIQKQYQAAEAFVAAMKGDTDRIAHDASLLHPFTMMGFPTSASFLKTIVADRDDAEADIKTQEKNLTDLNSDFSSLCDSLDSLVECINKTASNHSVNSKDLANDLKNLQGAMGKVFEAMKQKLQGDVYLAEMNSSAADQLTANQLAQLAEDAVQYESGEQGTLSTLMSSLQAMISNYRTAYNNANIDLNGYNIWDEVASYLDCGDAESNKASDESTMASATDMIHGLGALMSALGPEISSYMPQFTQVLDVIKAIMKEVQKILADPTLSAKEKQGAILGLVMFLLTFIQVVKQNVEGEKTKNNQQMSSGAIIASQDNIDDTMANQKIEEEVERNASILKTTLLICEVVLGAAMALMAPGFGTAFLIGMVTTLQALQTEGICDVMGGLTDAIDKAVGGQIGADLIVGGMEMALTMGGGAVLDGLAARLVAGLVTKAANTALAATEAVVEKAVQAALEAAGKVGDQAAKTAVENALAEVTMQAADKAAAGAAQQFLKQPFGVLMEMVAKGTLKQMLKETMERAAEEAVAAAVKDAATLAKLAARGVQSSEAIVEGAAKRAADEAVANVTGKAADSVAADSARSAGRAALDRGKWALVFAFANTGLLTEMFKTIGASGNTFEDIMQVIQQLVQMIAMMGGSGMVTESMISSLPRVVQLAQLGPNIVEAASNYGMYETTEQQAGAVTAMQMNGSVADLLHAFIDQLQKDANLDRDIMINEQTQEAQSTMSMAGHLHDGDNAAIQILISAAG
ncbi:MAG: hypothetical protein WCF19_05325 [Chlamydiales bacterium]